MWCLDLFILYSDENKLSKKADIVFKYLYITDRINKLLLLQYSKPLCSLVFNGMTETKHASSSGKLDVVYKKYS